MKRVVQIYLTRTVVCVGIPRPGHQNDDQNSPSFFSWPRCDPGGQHQKRGSQGQVTVACCLCWRHPSLLAGWAEGAVLAADGYGHVVHKLAINSASIPHPCRPSRTPEPVAATLRSPCVLLTHGQTTALVCTAPGVADVDFEGVGADIGTPTNISGYPSNPQMVRTCASPAQELWCVEAQMILPACCRSMHSSPCSIAA